MSGVLGLLGWYFLPNLITNWTQSIWYSVTIRAGEPKPTPGNPRYAVHNRRIRMLVISIYLIYTIIEADYDLRRQGNFYTLLSLSPDATEREIKSRFRRLAAVHHPDKSAPGEDDGTMFMALKMAADTLTNEASRFAYERFGPDVVGWKGVTTKFDYMFHGGIKVIVPHYIAYAAVQYLLGMFGYLDFARYWRWLALVSMCVFETHIATRPESRLLNMINPVVGFLFNHPPFLQFQVISFARRLCVTFYIALSQIGPLLLPRKSQIVDAEGGDKAVTEALEKAKAVVADLDTSIVRALDTELSPFKGDEEAVATVQRKIREWLVQNTIRADPMVKDAMGNSIRKRRVDAPTGARGNR